MNTWRKSTRCGASNTCVEVAEWRVAQACMNASDCVQIGDAGDAVAVRDSADPAGPVLVLSPTGWAGLVAEIKEGRDG